MPRARSLSRHGSQMARDGIVEPNVHLARELSLSDAPLLDLPYRAVLRLISARHSGRECAGLPTASHQPLIVQTDRVGVQSQMRSLARAECAADPARAGKDVLSGCAMLRWPQHGCMARRGGSPSWIGLRGLGDPGWAFAEFKPFRSARLLRNSAELTVTLDI